MGKLSRNCSASKGLIKKATVPICVAVIRAALSSRPVITMTWVGGDMAHSRARTSKPDARIRGEQPPASTT
jgi:hypothetical protein